MSEDYNRDTDGYGDGTDAGAGDAFDRFRPQNEQAGQSDAGRQSSIPAYHPNERQTPLDARSAGQGVYQADQSTAGQGGAYPAQPGQQGPYGADGGMMGQGGSPVNPNRGRGGHGHNRSEERSVSAMAISSLVLGVIAIIFSFIPIINNFAFVVGILGLVFGLVGVHATGRKGRKKGKGLSIAGTVLCILAMVITLAMQAGFSKAANSVSPSAGTTTSQKKDEGKSGNKSAESNTATEAPAVGDKAKDEIITLKATSTGSGSVAYGPAGATSQENFNGSWQKDITGDEAKKTHTMTVMGDIINQDPNQKLTCDVLVNGVSKDHKEATGSSAVVICNSPMF